MREPILIIAPHPDDEVYGCSSILADKKKALMVVYVTLMHPLFPGGENIREQEKLAETIGFEPIILPSHKQTNMLDKSGQAYLISNLECIFNECRPWTVLVPCPSYNQDHRVVYDAALTAMRPHDRNHFVKSVLLYEQPETWGSLRSPLPFEPNYYKELDLNFKLKLMNIYKSQMRGHRTPQHIEAIARSRGMQANMDCAEAFEVVRWIE